MRRDFVLVVAAVVFGCAYLLVGQMVTRDSRSDSQQIAALIASGERAVEHRDLADVMSGVSRNYSDVNGLTYPALRMRAAQALRNSSSLSVNGRVLNTRVNDSQAALQYKVSVKGDDGNLFSGTLTMDLKKEPVWRYGIFRARQWKVVSMDGYPTGPEGE